MGRPVFHEYSLPELIAASLAVVLVQRAPAPETVEPGAVLWSLEVLEVLHLNEAPVPAGGFSRDDLLPPSRVPTAGEVLEVLINRVAVTDLENRGRASSGASFAARRYQSELMTEQAPRWLAFLIERGGRFELTAQGAWESPQKLEAVRAGIRLAEQGLEGRKALRAAMSARLAQLSSSPPRQP